MRESQLSMPEGELEQEKTNQFWKSLRKKTHKLQEEELAERMRTNPTPTEEELAIGAFTEQIEPQARNAIFAFYRKGYTTHSSGFYGMHGEFQQIDGWFVIDEETKVKLQDEGYEVKMRVFSELESRLARGGFPGSTKIRFFPSKPNLDSENIMPILTELEERWNRMAEILPDKGKPAAPATALGHRMFRQRFCKK